MKSLVSPHITVRALLKARPLAVDLLDRRQVRFWDVLDRPVGEVVRREALGELLDAVAAAPVPGPDSDWLALPLHHLVDHLTEAHRSFLLHDLPDIAHLLDIHTLTDSEESEGLRAIHAAFLAFTRALQAHVEEEEDHLFPKVLRYEACLRDARVHPEFHRGSIQSYMAIRLSQEEKRLEGAGEELSTRIRRHAEAHPGSPTASELLVMLGRLRGRLDDHGDLETRVLFPTARDMERSLYNLGIDGARPVSGVGAALGA